MKKQEILQILMKEPFRLLTTREIIKKLKKIPSKTVYRQVNNLIKEDILFSKKIGQYNQIKLNLNSEMAFAELAKAEIEKKNKFLSKQTSLQKKLFLKFEERLNEVSQVQVILVFGSFAKGNQRTDSDLDLIILLNRGNRRLKQRIENLVHEIGYEFGEVRINHLIICLGDYFEMLQEKKENVGKQSFKEHVIIKGSYEFWKGLAKNGTGKPSD